MRRIACIFFLVLIGLFAQAQSRRIDSLSQLLQNRTEDTNRVNTQIALARALMYSNPDTTLLVAREALSLSKKLGYKKGEVNSLISTANVFNVSGNYPRALELFLEALKIANETADRILEQAVLTSLADTYFYSGDISRSISYSYKAIESNRKLGRLGNMYNGMMNLGDTYEKIGRLDSALILTKATYDYILQNKAYNSFGICLANLGNIYRKMGKNDSAMYYYRASKSYLREYLNDPGLSESSLGMADLFLKDGQKDSSVFYAKDAFAIASNIGYTEGILRSSTFLADYYRSVRNIDSAFAYQSITIAAKDSLFTQQKANEIQSLSFEETMRQQQIEEEKEKAAMQLRQNTLMGSMATLFIIAFLLFLNNRQKKKSNELLQIQKEQIDAKAHELEAQKETLQQSYNNVELLAEIGRKITSSLSVSTIISTVYDHVNALMDAAVFGIGIYHDQTKTIDFPATYENGQALPAYSNSVFDQNRLGSLCFQSGKEIVINDLSQEYAGYLQQLPAPIEGKQSASLIYLPLKVKEKMFGVITVQSFSKSAYTDYHLNMLRTIAIYAAIALENAESFKKLSETVNSLQETQKQLIQSEKMASLGELTAGIAHEIQNPLNFVNNFSEVSRELIDEMTEELRSGNAAVATDIASSIKTNLEKIGHHGRRADAIVKGMLQHSRSSDGVKESTDLNALCDEYLRLAYHGLRAKDNSFNAYFSTSFDPNMGNVELMPQDLGRVLLNLINNAFYAVAEKSKNADAGFKPTVTISTRKKADKVKIIVSDNGNGIPDAIRDKIFQPFFTTKPTGEGTGLGLSLSYDIVTKGHGGSLHVETTEGQGSVFTIQLPNQTPP
jgi:signal transduction histidine kinase